MKSLKISKNKNDKSSNFDLSPLQEWLKSPYIEKNFVSEMEAAYNMLLDAILSDPTMNGSPELCQTMNVFRGFLKIAKDIQPKTKNALSK